MAAGPVTVKFDLVKIVEDRRTFNVIAETKTGRDDNVVMMGAHLDSVHDGPGINDNGSGSAGILETRGPARRSTSNSTTRSASPGGAPRSSASSARSTTSTSLDETQQGDKIATYLNFDMIGSPNHIIGVYDADQSTYPAPAGVPIPAGSVETEDILTDWFDGRRPGLGRHRVLAGAPTTRPSSRTASPPRACSPGPSTKTAEEDALFGGTRGHDLRPELPLPRGRHRQRQPARRSTSTATRSPLRPSRSPRTPRRSTASAQRRQVRQHAPEPRRSTPARGRPPDGSSRTLACPGPPCGPGHARLPPAGMPRAETVPTGAARRTAHAAYGGLVPIPLRVGRWNRAVTNRVTTPLAALAAGLRGRPPRRPALRPPLPDPGQPLPHRRRLHVIALTYGTGRRLGAERPRGRRLRDRDARAPRSLQGAAPRPRPGGAGNPAARAPHPAPARRGRLPLALGWRCRRPGAAASLPFMDPPAPHPRRPGPPGGRHRRRGALRAGDARRRGRHRRHRGGGVLGRGAGRRRHPDRARRPSLLDLVGDLRRPGRLHRVAVAPGPGHRRRATGAPAGSPRRPCSSTPAGCSSPGRAGSGSASSSSPRSSWCSVSSCGA